MHELAAGGGVFAAMVVATLTVALGGGVGWWLRKLIAPEGAATTASELGRSWAGWIVFVSSFTMLARFFGKLDVNSFAAWLGGGGVWAIVAYALGWAYGNFFKFKDGSVAIPPTAATSSGFASSAGVDSVRARPVTQHPVHTASASIAAAADAIPPIDPMVVDEDAIYAAIANELKTGATNEGLWIRLFAECDGDENRTKVAYIKQRAAKLGAIEHTRIAAIAAESSEDEPKPEQIRLADISRLIAALTADPLSRQCEDAVALADLLGIRIVCAPTLLGKLQYRVPSDDDTGEVLLQLADFSTWISSMLVPRAKLLFVGNDPVATATYSGLDHRSQ